MANKCILAMTGAEIRQNPILPRKIAWMACHFSPYGRGITNLPEGLPENSLVILNDLTPIHGHDPERVAEQLRQVVDELGCAGVLLDFQRPGEAETEKMARFLTEALPCPVGVSRMYGENLDCPIFLPPVPLDMGASDYLPPWKGREIWLEAALDGLEIRVTEAGASFIYREGVSGEGLWDRKLHCHYRVNPQADGIRFTLWRTREDLDALLEEARELGVTEAVGLYQELGIEKQPPG